MGNVNSIVLGCARFSGLYGVNSKNAIGLNAIKKILKNNKEINQIDTAISYKNANKKLKKIKLEKFKVCSKIPWYNLSSPSIEEKIYDDVKKHLIYLKLKKLEVLYLHDSKLILGKKGKKLIKVLKKLKSEKIIKKIGLSVYSPSELNKLLKIFNPDVVQIPVNIFDRRFLKNNILIKLKKKRIKIYLRSIFLQSTLLKNYKKLPRYFSKWKNLFYNWEMWLKKNNLSKVEGCMSILNLVFVKVNLIIGVESDNQLKEILNSLKTKSLPPKNIFSSNQALINPTKWKIKK